MNWNGLVLLVHLVLFPVFVLGESNNFPNIDSLLSIANQDSEKSLLLPFNTTRVPETQESFEIQSHIINHFQSLPVSWDFQNDTFTERGHNFTNLIFSLDLDTVGVSSDGTDGGQPFVVLAAHYDSKKEPQGFVGATDSAASCSILMYIAYYLSKQIEQNPLETPTKGVKIVFFDGEEALEEWSEDDSIHGAKHLASLWNKENSIKDIELFVLLDLLGGIKTGLREIKVYDFFKATSPNYYQLHEIELQINELDNISKKFLEPHVKSFVEFHNSEENSLVIEDDHKPFFELGVPILHLIPYPFPSYWHTIEDDFDHLDIQGIKKWAKMLSVYAEGMLFEQ